MTGFWVFLSLCVVAIVVNSVITTILVNGGTDKQERDEAALRAELEGYQPKPPPSGGSSARKPMRGQERYHDDP